MVGVCLLIYGVMIGYCVIGFFFFQAEDGIRDLVRSRGLGDVYKRQLRHRSRRAARLAGARRGAGIGRQGGLHQLHAVRACLLYTSDAADERSRVDLGGRRNIKKKN